MERPPQVRWRLRPVQVPGLAPSIEVGEQGLVLGRDPQCEVVLDPELYPAVSAKHARLRVDGEALWLEDLGSTNGTLVAERSVRSYRLQHGELFRLGPEGPRFAALAPSVAGPSRALERTAFVQRTSGPALEEVRAELGSSASPPQPVPARGPGTGRIAWLAAGLALTLAVAGLWIWRQGSEGRRVLEDLQLETTALASQFEAERAQARERELAAEAWESERQRLAGERDVLTARLAELERQAATAAELSDLRGRLEVAELELGRFDPVAPLRELERVERAVVLIEAREVFRDGRSGQVLHFTDASADRPGGFNLEGRGEAFARESTGSGVCISPEGLILTNAHVVLADPGARPIWIEPGVALDRDRELTVVFSGSSVRHPARLVGYRRSEREDLALLAIEPFEGMPHVEGLDLESEAPPRGTEVFAIGFPLGKRVLQAGDTVIASAFKGIVSRAVDPFLQMDAAVHPGASGGPVIDASGRIVGIVTAMQSMDPRASASQIGYLLPIAHARPLLESLASADTR